MDESKITVEQKWIKDFVDEMKPVEETWLADFVDSMDPEDFDNRKD